jgi:hypothetical protein
VPLPAEDPNEILNVYTRISITAQWALSSMYTVKAATLPWQDVQERVVRLQSELEGMLPQMTDGVRLMLHFAWLDAMMLVTRPCLVAPQGCDDTARDMARQCVRAAQRVAQLLPNEPAAGIFQNGPWWCLSHYIVRAVGVFRLAMSQGAAEVELASMMEKLVRWLQWMAPDDGVAAQCVAAVQAERGDIVMGEGFPIPGQQGWGVAMGQPQFLAEFHGLDDLMDSDGVISMMVEQAQPEMLPMPPEYGAQYG